MPRPAAEAIVETTRTARDGLVTQSVMKAAISDLETSITWRIVLVVGLGLGAAKLIF